MSIWVTVLLFLLGLALIVKGGDWFLDGATKGMKHPANRLYVTEDGSYAIM